MLETPVAVDAAENPESAAHRYARRRWWLALWAITAVGLAVRVTYVLAMQRDNLRFGDAFFYHFGANFLAEGHGFVVPALYQFTGVATPAADHPPLYLVYLAMFSKLGFDTFLAHQLASCVLGAAAVALVGLTGREVAGPRVGLVAAAIAALWANIWVHDGLVMSETAVVTTTALALFAAYRLRSRPGSWAPALVGAACGLATLARPEGALLVLLVAIPVGWHSHAGGRVRWLRVGAAVLGSVVVLAPWLVRNAVTFDRPVFLSTNFDITLANSNCDLTWYGSRLGYWTPACLDDLHAPDGDQSVQGAYYRRVGRTYITAHERRLPVVLAARLGRQWGVYRPVQTVDLDTLEGRERSVGILGLVQYSLLVPFAIGGLVGLRRRRVPILYLLAPAVTVSAAALLAYGNTRFRAPAEVSIAIAAAVGLVAAWDWALARRTAPV